MIEVDFFNLEDVTTPQYIILCGLFGKLVATAVNVVTLPVAIVKDVTTLGGVVTERQKSYTSEKLEQIKEDAQ